MKMNPLLAIDRIHEHPETYLRSVGTLFARFDAQDSGNISYGVQVGDTRYFVKSAGRPDDQRPHLAHAARVELLRNAVRLNQSCQHHALPRLYHVIESPAGPLLVYGWLDGELLAVPRAHRDNPAYAYQRFRSLPAAKILRCLDTIYELHDQLARLGWVAVDFYDGCLIYDFAADRLGIVDLDTYHQGPFQNQMGRMFGSSRFMAPEEFELGAPIDQRTNVFVMGRAALLFLSDGTADASAFRGSRALFEVAARACEPDRANRYDSIASFYAAWCAAQAT
jgi:serine/threonine-protein kinase